MSETLSDDLSPATLAGLALLGSLPEVRRFSPKPPDGNTVTGAPKTGYGINASKIRGLVCGVTPLPSLPYQIEHSNTWAERAAILEYDGGLPRAVAERVATLLLHLDQMDDASAERRALDRELAALDRRASMGRQPGER